MFLIFLLLPAYHAFYYNPYPYEFNDTYPMIRLLDRKKGDNIPHDIPPNPIMQNDLDYVGFGNIIGNSLIQMLRTGLADNEHWNEFHIRTGPNFEARVCGGQIFNRDTFQEYLKFLHEYFLTITEPQLKMKPLKKHRRNLFEFELHFYSVSKWPEESTRNHWDFEFTFNKTDGQVNKNFWMRGLEIRLDCQGVPREMTHYPYERLDTAEQHIRNAITDAMARGSPRSAFDKVKRRFDANAMYDICGGAYIRSAEEFFNFVHQTYGIDSRRLKDYKHTTKQSDRVLKCKFTHSYGNYPYYKEYVEEWSFQLAMIYIYPGSQWPIYGVTHVRRTCPVLKGGSGVQDVKTMGDEKVKLTIEQIQNFHRRVGWDPVNAFLDNFDERSSNIEVCNEGSQMSRSRFKQWLNHKIGEFQSNRVLKGNIASYDPLDFTLLFEFKDNYMTVNREFKFKSRLNQGRYIFEQLIVSCHIRLG